MQSYVQQICTDIANAGPLARALRARLEHELDTVYFGGGTPSILAVAQLRQLFDSLRNHFSLSSNAEITVECAPGTITPELLATLVQCGVNRVSLGVQSFVDLESRSVGRLHDAETTLHDIDWLRAFGISNINLDLIIGLPHQTRDSWEESLRGAIESGVPHISVYMLEVDEDSRLGRELLASGARYHAHFVPDEDLIADLYVRACAVLKSAGIHQYEISNFARPGFESQHNLKYWRRQPYIGFGVDAHSMLPSGSPEYDALRFAMPDSLETFLTNAGSQEVERRGIKNTPIRKQNAWEETFFLGLRLNLGVDLQAAEHNFGTRRAKQAQIIARELVEAGLATLEAQHLSLTTSGRLLSNEVFQMFLAPRDRTLERSDEESMALSTTMH
jgi:oxygen-independent coproporphyrinogen-3 oxidase